jgi:GrpB-like predicted nucleotidyltransferase (UPF0157 family)
MPPESNPDAAHDGSVQRVSVVSYDASWPARYERESKRVLAALGSLALDIEHIGSTSIDGVAAKPTIDILVGAHGLEIPTHVMNQMAQVGYEYRGELGVPGRRYFRKGDRYPRDFNVHIVVWRERLWNDYLAFRDYLRDYPERAQEYSDLKQQILSSAGGATMPNYAAGKEPFIAETLRRAQDAQRVTTPRAARLAPLRVRTTAWRGSSDRRVAGHGRSAERGAARGPIRS